MSPKQKRTENFFSQSKWVDFGWATAEHLIKSKFWQASGSSIQAQYSEDCSTEMKGLPVLFWPNSLQGWVLVALWLSSWRCSLPQRPSDSCEFIASTAQGAADGFWSCSLGVCYISFSIKPVLEEGLWRWWHPNLSRAENLSCVEVEVDDLTRCCSLTHTTFKDYSFKTLFHSVLFSSGVQPVGWFLMELLALWASCCSKYEIGLEAPSGQAWQ